MIDGPLRAILFDLDGLMVDTEPLYWDAARTLARQYGKTITEVTLNKMMGVSRIESMRAFAADMGITALTPEQLLEQREVLMMGLYSKGVEPMRGLQAILRKFHGRLKLGVATNSPKNFTDVLLPALGVDRFFDIVQTGDEIVRGKPDPEVYLKAMSRMNVNPVECVVLEDSLAGATAGKRAGAYVIAVPSPLTINMDFSFADARAAHLDEASEYIERLLEKATPRERP